jgi:hypothetical protein
MVEPRRRLVDIWKERLDEHKRHPTFRMHSDPQALSMGFSCRCSGAHEVFNVNIRDIRAALPAAREAAMRAFNYYSKAGTKKLRKERHKADMTARALLFRHLTREQKWDFRATGQFLVQDKDGRSYTIRKAYGHNVKLLDENGQPSYEFCVVPKDESLPVHDLMLAYKVVLESDAAKFLKVANVKDLKNGDVYTGGEFIFNPDAPKEPTFRAQIRQAVANLHEEAVAHQNPQLTREEIREAMARHVREFDERQVVERQRNEAAREVIVNRTLDPAILYERFGVPVDELEHPEEWARQQLERTRRPIQNLLNEDIVPNGGIANFDSIDGFGFVLTEEYDVVPVSGDRILVPQIITGMALAPEEPIFDENLAVLKLIMGIPAATFRTLDEVQNHFRSQDIPWTQVLIHPETITDLPGILYRTDDERVPKGKVYCLTEGDFLGVRCVWAGGLYKGYAIFNPFGICIYEPPGVEVQP